MNIISYRGPYSAGGVSGALSTIFENLASQNEIWWHLSGRKILKRESTGKLVACVCKIPHHIIEGHYRYCNNFLWPVFHDLPVYANFNEFERTAYQAFNLSFGWNMRRFAHEVEDAHYFIQDYQLAILPFFIQKVMNVKVDVFWHVPWPKKVLDLHTPGVAEIANGILSANQIGFHTLEYANNFLQFVHQHMPDYTVNFNKMYVRKTYPTPAMLFREDWLKTKVLTCPLGIDSTSWDSHRDQIDLTTQFADAGVNFYQPFVLSVDRADYTKGVIERLDSIDQFFRTNPDWRGRVYFLQACQRTRSGLPDFDHYWNDCLNKVSEINQRWATAKWKPIVWITKPIEPVMLSSLYRRASALLVSSLRDGLNLTAKEFVVCSDSGVLLLSRYAGAWSELKDGCLSVDPLEKDDMADRLLEALSMPDEQKMDRLRRLKAKVKSNPLLKWWNQFTFVGDERRGSVRECLLDMRGCSVR